MKMKGGGGIGLVMVAVAMVVVLLLVAQSWKKIAPTALDIDNVGRSGQVDSYGEDAAAAGLRSGDLPNISGMEQTTDAHAADVQKALNEIE